MRQTPEEILELQNAGPVVTATSILEAKRIRESESFNPGDLEELAEAEILVESKPESPVVEAENEYVRPKVKRMGKVSAKKIIEEAQKRGIHPEDMTEDMLIDIGVTERYLPGFEGNNDEDPNQGAKKEYH